MSRLARTLLVVSLLSLSMAAVRVDGQAPVAAQPGGESDPGVHPIRLIDRDEIRISRVELDPAAVRRVHTHDDVEYHVWAPESGTLEITIGQDSPKVATRGQSYFMKKGTPHSFRNVGTTSAVVFEVFIRKSTSSAAAGSDEVAALALARALVHQAGPGSVY